jgi:hypothetical protein
MEKKAKGFRKQSVVGYLVVALILGLAAIAYAADNAVMQIISDKYEIMTVGDGTVDVLTVLGDKAGGHKDEKYQLKIGSYDDNAGGQIIFEGGGLGYQHWSIDNYQGYFRIFEPYYSQLQTKTRGAFQVMLWDDSSVAHGLHYTRDGYLGIGYFYYGNTPQYPIEMTSGAHVTVGGVWTDASSREYKENISKLKREDALSALKKLKPVTFNFKKDKSESYAGFIAEDVPELVATNDRKGLAPMDIVAVLTKVVQEQQTTIEQLKKEVEELKAD